MPYSSHALGMLDGYSSSKKGLSRTPTASWVDQSTPQPPNGNYKNRENFSTFQSAVAAGMHAAYFFKEPDTKDKIAGLKAVQSILDKIRLSFLHRSIAGMKAKFLGWNAARKAEQARKMKTVMQRWINSKLGAAFRKWRQDCGAGAKKEKMLKFLMRIRMAKVAAALNRWTEWYEDMCAERDKMRAIMNRFINTARTQAYNRWREWYADLMEQKAKLKLSLMRMMNRALANAFNSWTDWYADMMAQKEQLRKAMQRMMDRSLSKGWNTWVEFLEMLENQRSVANRALARWTQQSLTRAFCHWRDLAAEGLLGDPPPPPEPTTGAAVDAGATMGSRPELEEEIDFSSMKRYHDFPLGPVGDYEPRKVMNERSYAARQRTFQLLSHAKQHTGIEHSRKYIRSTHEMRDPKGSIPGSTADGLYRAAHPTEMPWTALHTTDKMHCTAKPARDILSEYMLDSHGVDSAAIREMQERSERSHRDNKKKFFGKWVHDDYEAFDTWLRKGGDVQDTKR